MKSNVKLITSKIDCIRLGYGPMRLVHRRNNPNKETLIHIPLSHATVIQAYRIKAANHAVAKTRIHDRYNHRSKTGTSNSQGRNQHWNH